MASIAETLLIWRALFRACDKVGAPDATDLPLNAPVLWACVMNETHQFPLSTPVYLGCIKASLGITFTPIHRPFSFLFFFYRNKMCWRGFQLKLSVSVMWFPLFFSIMWPLPVHNTPPLVKPFWRFSACHIWDVCVCVCARMKRKRENIPTLLMQVWITSTEGKNLNWFKVTCSTLSSPFPVSAFNLHQAPHAQDYPQ